MSHEEELVAAYRKLHEDAIKHFKLAQEIAYEHFVELQEHEITEYENYVMGKAREKGGG